MKKQTHHIISLPFTVGNITMISSEIQCCSLVHRGIRLRAYMSVESPTIKTKTIMGRKSDQPNHAFVFPGFSFTQVIQS